jgi:hypothetical protein
VYYGVLDRRLLALAAAPPGQRAGFVADRASRWRAADMAGILVRGSADSFVLAGLQTGQESLHRRVGDSLPSDPAVVRVRPEVVVWWKGWTSGTVSP